MPAGRPTDYTPELADKICAEIASGHSLRTICSDESMPCMASIYSWLRTKPEFLEIYEKAKEDQSDALAEEMLDIADDGANDWMLTNDPENLAYRVVGENVQRSRLRVDTRKWIASKLKPKKYGDKQSVEVGGKDGGAIDVTVRAGAAEAVRGLISALTAGRANSDSGAAEVDKPSTPGTNSPPK